ncbi:N-6 DNA methylase [Amycolatopsis pretoriensis]|uniref:N-6 DNA methylase n=1 Tax=Amycolatopsis pretoriensis TaxID=218821 RepID=UPI001FC93177|nr:N-6 DNA methylase [Amycolatopsis pretoriensis]
MKIAVEVARAWHKGGGPDRPEVPLGVVATLALAGLTAHRKADVADWVRGRSPADFLRLARWVWRAVLAQRPDVLRMAAPIVGWLHGEGEQLAGRIKSTADAALAAGQLDLTGGDRRFDADLLGPVLGALRSPAATKVDAQMYTPGDVALALTSVMLGDVKQGQVFVDDTVGTGGLFRAAAQVVRDRGLDPTALTWYGADVDELAVAAAAVNSVLWQLGTNVVLYVGDPLAEPDWSEAAAQQKVQFQREVHALRGVLAALDLENTPR